MNILDVIKSVVDTETEIDKLRYLLNSVIHANNISGLFKVRIEDIQVGCVKLSYMDLYDTYWSRTEIKSNTYIRIEKINDILS